MMTFTDSTDRAKHWYMSSGESWSSRRARSTLLTWSTGLTRSEMAWRSTVSVCTHTPSTQSTTVSAPSVMRSAAVTSEEKSTCPGESMRLISNGSGCASSPLTAHFGVYNRDIAALFMVIPRRCSSSRKSMNLNFPASF